MTTANALEIIAATNACLVCGANHPGSADRMVDDHNTPGAEDPCPGSLMPPSTDDPDLDARRRYAIGRYTDAIEAITSCRDTIAARIEASVALSGVLDECGIEVVELEVVADLWRRVVVDGDWFTALTAALKLVAAPGVFSSRDLTRAIEGARREGARAWLLDARADLIEDLPRLLERERVALLLYAL